MPSLSDRIDHLAATARAICISAATTVPSEDNLTPSVIPFTRAVLDTTLGDLIRDIDASELGLFTLVPAPDADVRNQPDNGTRRGEISRVEFPGATPLRKQPAKRDDMFRPKEYEPEVYAHAALKYLDRYQSIRRMPRARSQVIAILEQLEEIRENIKSLNDTLQELTSAGITPDIAHPANDVAEEERRIADLQDRLTELRNQKDAILRSNEPKPALQPKITSRPIPKQLRSPSPELESQEDAFWSTPAAPMRTLRFTDRLLEEEPDFAKLSAMPFDSPETAPPESVFARLAAGRSPTRKGNLSDSNILGRPEMHESEDEDEDSEEDLDDQTSLLDVQLDPECDLGTSEHVLDVGMEENLGDETVVLHKAPLEPPDKLLSSPSVDNQKQIVPHPADAQPSPSSSLKAGMVRVTPELERIVARILGTVGDILLPGKSGEHPPPREILDLIESIVTQSPSPSSPASSISSISSATAGPTPHQVNTARLLHALLTAPTHTMPLNQLKAAIGGTRALYACVAKKLIRIDRGGGEQIVLFDGC